MTLSDFLVQFWPGWDRDRNTDRDTVTNILHSRQLNYKFCIAAVLVRLMFTLCYGYSSVQIAYPVRLRKGNDDCFYCGRGFKRLNIHSVMKCLYTIFKTFICLLACGCCLAEEQLDLVALAVRAISPKKMISGLEVNLSYQTYLFISSKSGSDN